MIIALSTFVSSFAFANIDIKVKDQFSKVIEAKALLRSFVEQHQHDPIDLVKKIEHIVVDGETILPSIELLFESQKSSNIYKVVE
nr:hypothetical protein [Acinetobacter sp. YH18001]